MTKNSIFSFLMLAIGCLGFAFTLPVESVKVNTQKSQVVWTGEKVTGQHTGTINVKDGELTFEGDKLTGGSFSIDMSSIACTDLEGEWADKLVGHLKSDDFFGVKNYPTTTFKITNVANRGSENNYRITGDVTIKETTKSVKFNAIVSKSAASATIVLDRTDFDVRYGSGSFFDNLGDKTIYDEFTLAVKLVLN